MSANSRQGEAHGAAKLTEEDVRLMRGRSRASNYSLAEHQASLRKRRGVKVSRSAISMALTGATWSHVPGALRAKSPQQAARLPRRRL